MAMLASGEQASAGEFWTDADIADSASTSITGSNGDSFVGFGCFHRAMADPISNFAASATNGTIDLSGGGNNYVQLGSFVARSGGTASYIALTKSTLLR